VLGKVKHVHDKRVLEGEPLSLHSIYELVLDKGFVKEQIWTVNSFFVLDDRVRLDSHADGPCKVMEGMNGGV